MKTPAPGRKIKAPLNPCPCCGAPPSAVVTRDGSILITCSKNGCKMVTGEKLEEIVKIWNERSFRDADETDKTVKS